MTWIFDRCTLESGNHFAWEETGRNEILTMHVSNCLVFDCFQPTCIKLPGLRLFQAHVVAQLQSGTHEVGVVLMKSAAGCTTLVIKHISSTPTQKTTQKKA